MKYLRRPLTKRFHKVRLPLWPRRHRPCGRILRNLMVYSNGRVGACDCVDFEAASELILGNVADMSRCESGAGSACNSPARTGDQAPEHPLSAPISTCTDLASSSSLLCPSPSSQLKNTPNTASYRLFTYAPRANPSYFRENRIG
jgi:hypothetical protein